MPPNPAPPELALPLWGQITALLVFIASAVGVVRNAWTKSKPEPSSDAVVVSAAFADGTSIAKLTRAVDNLAGISERAEHAAAQRWDDLLEAVAGLRREQGRTTEEVRLVGDVLTRAHKENQHDFHGVRTCLEALVRLFRPKPLSEILRDEAEPIATPPDDPVIPESLRRSG